MVWPKTAMPHIEILEKMKMQAKRTGFMLGKQLWYVKFNFKGCSLRRQSELKGLMWTRHVHTRCFGGGQSRAGFTGNQRQHQRSGHLRAGVSPNTSNRLHFPHYSVTPSNVCVWAGCHKSFVATVVNLWVLTNSILFPEKVMYPQKEPGPRKHPML